MLLVGVVLHGDVKMSENNFVPGTRVVALWNDDCEYVVYDVADHYGDNDFTFLSGVVLDQPALEGHVTVQWDENDYFDYAEDGATSEAVPVDILTLESEQASLEEEFNLVSKQIDDKITEACKLIAEADAIADSLGTTLHDLEEPNSSLEGALRGAGWRTSSWHC